MSNQQDPLDAVARSLDDEEDDGVEEPLPGTCTLVLEDGTWLLLPCVPVDVVNGEIDLLGNAPVAPPGEDDGPDAPIIVDGDPGLLIDLTGFLGGPGAGAPSDPGDPTGGDPSDPDDPTGGDPTGGDPSDPDDPTGGDPTGGDPDDPTGGDPSDPGAPTGGDPTGGDPGDPDDPTGGDPTGGDPGDPDDPEGDPVDDPGDDSGDNDGDGGGGGDPGITLVATGDSVTSAHSQFGFGPQPPPCVNTIANNTTISYAGQYFEADPSVTEYYNFARTGFTTGQMLGAGPATPDACGGPWGGAKPPIQRAEEAIATAKAAGRKAYFVTTGGANNVNWTEILGKLAECRVLELAAEVLGPQRAKLSWLSIDERGFNGGKRRMFPYGGACQLQVFHPIPALGSDWFFRVGVPRFAGLDGYATIAEDAAKMVQRVLTAGADKVVWMLYYDISPAEVDVGNLLWRYVKQNPDVPEFVRGLLEPRIKPRLLPLIDPLYVGDARRIVAAMNNAVTRALPANGKVKALIPPALTRAEIQQTAVGGCPHPNRAGHVRLAGALATAFAAIA